MRLEDVEEADDLVHAVRDAARHDDRELVIDLRCVGRPSIVVSEAVEIVVANVSPARTLRFVVSSEPAASRAREALARDSMPSSSWRVGEIAGRSWCSS